MSGICRGAGWRRLRGLCRFGGLVRGLMRLRFAGFLWGRRLGRVRPGHCRRLGRLAAGARDAGALRAASAALALAVSDGGADWRYGLRYARDQAVYAVAHGLVGEGAGAGGSGPGFAVGAAGLGTASVLGSGSAGAVVGPAVRVGIGLARLGPWGALAAAALGVGLGAYLYWYGEGDVAPGSPSGPVIAAAEPPEDAKDPDGAKAPGQAGGGARF